MTLIEPSRPKCSFCHQQWDVVVEGEGHPSVYRAKICSNCIQIALGLLGLEVRQKDESTGIPSGDTAPLRSDIRSDEYVVGYVADDLVYYRDELGYDHGPFKCDPIDPVANGACSMCSNNSYRSRTHLVQDTRFRVPLKRSSS